MGNGGKAGRAPQRVHRVAPWPMSPTRNIAEKIEELEGFHEMLSDKVDKRDVVCDLARLATSASSISSTPSRPSKASCQRTSRRSSTGSMLLPTC
jgi:hypothetical protein